MKPYENCAPVITSGQTIDLVELPSKIYLKCLQSPSKPKPLETSQLTGSPEEVAELLSQILNDGSNPRTEERADWLRIVMAAHNATAGNAETEQAVQTWSSAHPTYCAEETEAAWRSCFGEKSITNKAQRVGIRTLRYEARKAVEATDKELEAAYDAIWKQEGLPIEHAAPSGHGIEFVNGGSLTGIDARPYLVKGLLSVSDFACVSAAPGTGKSLFAPYVAYCIATGHPLFGRKVSRGAAWYIAAEDQSGMEGRLAALRQAEGNLGDFFLVKNVSDLITQKDSQLSHLLARAKVDRPALIVIDTLALAFPGLEENSPEAMSRVVSTCRQFTNLGCAVLLVHHTTKDDRQGLPRGHSLLNGALDIAFHLKKEGDKRVRCRLTKNRNGASDQSFAFEIEVKKIGDDIDGDPIFYPICKELTAGSTYVKSRSLSKPQKAALNLLQTLSEREGEWVCETQWRKDCLESGKISSAALEDSRRRAVDRAVIDLDENHHIEIREQKVRVITESDSEEPFE